MKHHATFPLIRRGFFLMLLAIALVVLADWFFYGHPVGWTVGAYGLLLASAVVLIAGQLWRRASGVVVMVGVVGLTLAAVEEPGALTIFLLALGIITLAMIGRMGWTTSPVSWVQRWLRFGAMGWLRVFHDARQRRHRLQRLRRRPPLAIRLARLWTIPVALSLVFVVLFKIANPVVSLGLERFGTLLSDGFKRLPESLSPWRIAFWIFVFVWVWALLRIRMRQKPRPALRIEPASETKLERLFSSALVVRCLALFNAVFAVQTLLDARYLWGGAALPDGMSYAAYAHRGAYPLVVTALLAAAFVVVTFRHHGPAQRSPVARKLVYLWLLQNVALVVSAGWRLGRYIEIYGLSRWRVAAMLWMLLVTVGLTLIIYRIVRCRSNAWLLRANALSALLMLYTCAPINFDGMIAMFNVRHCREVGMPGVPIDLHYLSSLGPDAIPALDWLTTRLNDDAQRSAVQSTSNVLRAELAAKTADWRGWTWRRQRLLALGH